MPPLPKPVREGLDVVMASPEGFLDSPEIAQEVLRPLLAWLQDGNASNLGVLLNYVSCRAYMMGIRAAAREADSLYSEPFHRLETMWLPMLSDEHPPERKR